MASNALRTIIQHFHRLVGAWPAGGLADADLLQRFLTQHDQAAFEALVWRHGPMVWNVCQRLLHHPHDAEDAFQATFLAFVREAGSIRQRTSLSSWLYKVAYRVALKVKARAAKQARHEIPAMDMLAAKPVPPECLWRDLRPVLDDEVNRLPMKYRLPFVLCYFQGKTTAEAAKELGCPRGTVATRLAWARERLRSRLTRRGLALSTGVLASSLSQNAASAVLPTVLVHAAVRTGLLFMAGKAAAGSISAPVAALAEGVLKAMTVTKMMVAAALFLAVGGLAAGTGLALHRPRVAQQPEVQPQQRRQVAAEEAAQPMHAEERARSDRYGDPLPDGALARFGTVRWRALGEVEALAFAPDGKVVASASPRGAAPNRGLCLFEVASGKRTKHICPSDTYFWRIAFSSDGTRLACSCTVEAGDRDKSTVLIWDLPGGRKLQEFDAEHVQWLGWSADGQPLAVLLEKGVIIFRELATGRERRFQADNLPEPLRGLTACAYTTEGKVLAVPDDQSVIHVWDTVTGEKRCALQAKGNYFRRLALSPDGRLLASLTQDAASAEYAVQFWDVVAGKATRTVAADQKHLDAVVFAPDGKTLATVGWNDVRFWDVATGRERSRAQGVPSFAQNAAFSPDSKTLATAERYSGAIHLWDVATGVLKPEVTGHTSLAYQMAFSPDGRRVATGGMDGTIFVWDPTTGESLAQVRRGGWVRACAFSADGRSLFSSWTDDKLVFSDAATGRELHRVRLDDPDRPDTEQSGLYMHLSGDGKTLVATSSYSSKKGGAFIGDLLVSGWDTATRKPLFRRTRARVDFGIAVSPDVKLLVVPQGGSVGKAPKVPAGQGPLQMEDLATGEEVLIFPALDGQTMPLAFSPDGRLLASNTFGPAPPGQAVGRPDEKIHTLRLWEVATAAEVLAVPTVINARIAFSVDSRVLAMSAPSQEILLWDLGRGKELRRIKVFDATVTSLAFSPDSRRLVSGLSDSTVLVWDATAALKTGNRGSLDAESAAQAWADLGADARKAFAARGAMAESPAKAVSLLKERLAPVQSADARRLRQLLTDLDSAHFAVRENARKGLEEMGDLATEALRRALAEKTSPEACRRLKALLEKLRGPVTRPEALRALRAVALLEDIATPEARQILETLAEGAPEARLTQEAKASLERLAKRRACLP